MEKRNHSQHKGNPVSEVNGYKNFCGYHKSKERPQWEIEVVGQQINPANDEIHNTKQEVKRTERLQPS